MSTKITYAPKGLTMSSGIGDIVARTDAEAVDVMLKTSDGQELLTERFYAHSGLVTLRDPASLVEAWMRGKGASFAEFSLTVSSSEPDDRDRCDMKVLYCEDFYPNFDVSRFARESFLTTLPMRRIAPDADASLSFLAEAGESVACHVSAVVRDEGDAGRRRFSFTLDEDKTADKTGVFSFRVTVPEILTRSKGERVELFTVSCGGRAATFFVDPSLCAASTLNSFTFRNCFNAWETATVAAVTTAKTEVDRSLAVLGGQSQFYDRSVTRTYEAETTPLSDTEAAWLEQLFASHEVVRLVSNPTDDQEPLVAVPVLVTDSTCEVQDGDEKLNSVKFTWRYADNRPLARLPLSPGVFSQPYNPAFC